jgi:hypothetical protein
VHRDVSPAADVLVVGALVRILEATPAADVVDQDGFEVGCAGFDVVDQLFEGVAALDPQAALARIGVGADDDEVACVGVAADRGLLVLGRILLVLRGHADVLRRPPRKCGLVADRI